MIAEDQEIRLDHGLKNIKSQAFHIHSTIEKNNLRQCLKETSLMLCELRTNALTPKNYYHLYTAAFDEMQYISDYFKEEIRRGRRIKDLYESVQQAKFILPRLYLVITVGAIYMETQVTSCKSIIFTLLQMVKGIQNPIRGLFTRYYLLKMLKDKLPDEGNEYETENGKMKDTIEFILQNLEEMNRLWIRLSADAVGREKMLREKERNELKTLVGENVTRLSSLNGLKLDVYKSEVFPKIKEILLKSKDLLSQQYLMECVIHAFPDEFNINCMDDILDTLAQLPLNVDVNSLFIALMNKLARYVSESSKENESILTIAENIFSPLKESIDKHIQSSQTAETYDNNNNNNNNNNIHKLIELEVAFMKFTMSCCPQKDKIKTISHILSTSKTILSDSNNIIETESVKQIEKLLAVPLESKISLFDMPEFPALMEYLDYSSRTALAKRIIDSVINNTTSNNEQIDTLDKLKQLLSFIKPLIEETKNTSELTTYQFEEEQISVSKLAFSIKTTNPKDLLEMYTELKNVYIKGGVNKKKYTLPSLANAIILFCYKFSNCFDNINGLLPKQITASVLHEEFISSLDVSFITDGDTFYDFLFQVYTILHEVINSISQDNPEMALKMYLNAASQINTIYSNREKFEEACASFINTAISIYQEGKYNIENKIDLLNHICGTLMKMNILNSDILSQIIPQLQQSATTMVRRNDQCAGLISLSDLYYQLLGDKNKVVDCLKKAKRYADFSMTVGSNLYLYVVILNKAIYFIEENIDNIVPVIEDVIETIKNHIETIKYENKNAEFLPSIEKYFENTIQVIKNRKTTSDKKAYSEISLN